MTTRAVPVGRGSAAGRYVSGIVGRMESLLFIALIAAIFIIPTAIQARRQRRRMDEIQEMQNSLRSGDRVVTTSGVHGVVRGMTDELVDLEVSVGVTMTWERSAVIRKVEAPRTPRTDEGNGERFWEDEDIESVDTGSTERSVPESDPGTGTDGAATGPRQ